MNHFFRLLLFVCGFAITLTACTNEDNGTPGTDGQNAKYTIMIYGCGGKNVDTQMEPGTRYRHVFYVEGHIGHQGVFA